MAYDPGALDKTLAAAVGDDSALIKELRGAFLDSAGRQVYALHSAVNDQQWQAAAWRLKGLAASFGVTEMMTLAGEAAEGIPFDRTQLGRIDKALIAFEKTSEIDTND